MGISSKLWPKGQQTHQGKRILSGPCSRKAFHWLRTGGCKQSSVSTHRYMEKDPLEAGTNCRFVSGGSWAVQVDTSVEAEVRTGFILW